MKLIKPFLCILLSLIAFASCKKDIEFNEEISKPMVVVHSFISPDTVVSASVSLSRFFLNDTVNFQKINNADVAVIVNGILKEKMSLITDGQYKGTYKPAIGDVVKFVVKIPSMNEVSSQTSICNPTVISSVDTSKVIQQTFYDASSTDTAALNTLFKINYTLKFTDNGNEKNYYRLIVHSREHYYKFISNFVNFNLIDEINDRYDFNFTDVVVGNNKSSNSITGTVTGENTNSNNKYNVFSDDLFNGKTMSLTFNVDYWLFKRFPSYSLDSGKNYDSGASEKIEVFVSLQSISKEYYYYLKSRSASGGDDFYSEPVQITNNIVGGIGFFGSYTSSNVVKFDL